MSAQPLPRHWFAVPGAPASGTLRGLRDTLAHSAARVHTLRAFRLLWRRSGPQVQAYVHRCAHDRWPDGLCAAGDCAGESPLPIPREIDAPGPIRITQDAPTP